MSRGPARAGEFDLIRRYFAPLAAGHGAGLGLVDDAAVFTPPPGRDIVVTTDTMVEGVHYPQGEAPDLVARKLLRVNLSDLAAMGARPELYFLNTAWPRDRDEQWIAAFAGGLAEDQGRFGIALGGGDTVGTSGPATFTLTAIGSVASGAAVRRSAARVGDEVYVSGTIGDAAFGLDVALGRPLPGAGPAECDALHRRFVLPDPRLELGVVLGGGPLPGTAEAPVHGMADVSDGLVADLGHICEASGVGAIIRIEAVPLSEAARVVVAHDPSMLLRAVTGGDDYELVFTAPPSAARSLRDLSRRLGLALTCIGEIVAGEGVVVRDAAGAPLVLESTGFRHR